MIDPLEAVIQHLRASSNLTAAVGDRIAVQHRYGMDADAWPLAQPAVTAQYSGGGEPDTASADPMQRVELEFRMYGPAYVDCSDLWRRLLLVSRDTQRVTVQTGAGRALLYWFIPRAKPRADTDPETGIPVMVATFEAAVSETALD